MIRLSSFSHWLLFAVVAGSLQACSSEPQVTSDHYRRAEALLAPNVRETVYHLEARPNWLEDSTGFWHVTHTREGKRFFHTSIDKAETKPAFDHPVLAAALAEKTGEEIDPADLPFDRIRIPEDGVIAFRHDEADWEFDTESMDLSRQDENNDERPRGVSPDGRWQAFIRDYNLFVRHLDNGREIQLSTDGRHQYEYASTYGWGNLMEGEGGSRQENLFVSWAPDSRKLLTYVTDLSLAEKMYLLDFSVDSLFRPRLLSYYRGSPGDTTVVYYKPVIFDLDRGTQIPVDMEPFPHFFGTSFRWMEQSDSLFALLPHRGYKQADIVKVDAATGNTGVLVSETSDTSVEYRNKVMQRVGDDKLLVSSQASGWNQLYLHDWHTGELINQVTSGEYVVRRLFHVDEDNERIYFTAGGKEEGRDP